MDSGNETDETDLQDRDDHGQDQNEAPNSSKVDPVRQPRLLIDDDVYGNILEVSAQLKATASRFADSVLDVFLQHQELALFGRPYQKVVEDGPLTGDKRPIDLVVFDCEGAIYDSKYLSIWSACEAFSRLYKLNVNPSDLVSLVPWDAVPSADNAELASTPKTKTSRNSAASNSLEDKASTAKGSHKSWDSFLIYIVAKQAGLQEVPEYEKILETYFDIISEDIVKLAFAPTRGAKSLMRRLRTTGVKIAAMSTAETSKIERLLKLSTIDINTQYPPEISTETSAQSRSDRKDFSNDSPVSVDYVVSSSGVLAASEKIEYPMEYYAMPHYQRLLTACSAQLNVEPSRIAVITCRQETASAAKKLGMRVLGLSMGSILKNAESADFELVRNEPSLLTMKDIFGCLLCDEDAELPNKPSV